MLDRNNAAYKYDDGSDMFYVSQKFELMSLNLHTHTYGVYIHIYLYIRHIYTAALQ